MAKRQVGRDLYAILGLNKDCTPGELRKAYKKLAMGTLNFIEIGSMQYKWHPDRCSASGDSKFIEEAKGNFQAIQEAYSVLSDENKRFLYDAGVYDSDDDDENDMGDFLGEMVAMMNQTKPCEDGQQSFEELQNLFQDIFRGQGEFSNPVSQGPPLNNGINKSYSCSYDDDFNSNKKSCSSMNSGNTKMDFGKESMNFSDFCVGLEGGNASGLSSKGRAGSGGRRTVRRQKGCTR